MPWTLVHITSSIICCCCWSKLYLKTGFSYSHCCYWTHFHFWFLDPETGSTSTGSNYSQMLWFSENCNSFSHAVILRHLLIPFPLKTEGSIKKKSYLNTGCVSASTFIQTLPYDAGGILFISVHAKLHFNLATQLWQRKSSLEMWQKFRMHPINFRW